VVQKLYDSCYSVGLTAFNFTQLFPKPEKRCSRGLRSVNAWCHCPLTPLFYRTRANISINLFYCQKLESLIEVGSQTNRRVENRTLRKIAIQDHCRSRISGLVKSRRTDCVLLYNNAGLIYKASEEIASENAENCRYRQPHCRLMTPPQGTTANICINLI